MCFSFRKRGQTAILGGLVKVCGMSDGGGLDKYKLSTRDPGQVTDARRMSEIASQKGDLEMGSPEETFGF